MLLRIHDVIARTGFPRSTLYLRIKQGLFTKPVRIGARAVAWPESEVNAIVRALVAGENGRRLTDLVRQLHSLRISARKA